MFRDIKDRRKKKKKIEEFTRLRIKENPGRVHDKKPHFTMRYRRRENGSVEGNWRSECTTEELLVKNYRGLIQRNTTLGY